MVECVEECEFIRFDGIKKFRCGFYDEDLKAIMLHDDEICFTRCDECLKNGDVPKELKLETIREHIGHINDDFYAFKSSFEEKMVLVFELLQKLEEEREEKRV